MVKYRYDGMYMIVVHVTQGDTLTGNPLLRLTEVNNNETERCYAANGLLQKTFLPVKSSLQDSLNQLPKKAVVEEFCGDCVFLRAGYYAVKLTGQERYCMLYDDNNNLERPPCNFEIRYGTQKIALSPKQVYRLCWAKGAWSRIQPVEITGLAPQKTTRLKYIKANKL